tara:strand:+ start:1747 stop:1947 length:201 start_codon:yes stop_codon:yes gene_type:complete
LPLNPYKHSVKNDLDLLKTSPNIAFTASNMPVESKKKPKKSDLSLSNQYPLYQNKITFLFRVIVIE